MRTLVLAAGAMALAVLLSVQLTADRGASRPSGPLVGTSLQDLALSRVVNGETSRLTDMVADGETCTILVMGSTGCSVCAGMRATWNHDFAVFTDSVDAEVAGLWVFEEDREAVSDFLDSYPTLRERAYVTSGRPGLKALGLFGTPTTFLVDREGRLAYGVTGDRLPSFLVGREVCS